MSIDIPKQPIHPDVNPAPKTPEQPPAPIEIVNQYLSVLEALREVERTISGLPPASQQNVLDLANAGIQSLSASQPADLEMLPAYYDNLLNLETVAATTTRALEKNDSSRRKPTFLLKLLGTQATNTTHK